ncbi:hypothetical protein J25TS5_08400 [Paenibacillus faecis]|nr:hypothetical protein J25TS5_08400 [Paenibacillus faecis]
MTGDDKLSQLTTYKAKVTARPVFSILAPNVTSIPPVASLFLIFTRIDMNPFILSKLRRQGPNYSKR